MEIVNPLDRDGQDIKAPLRRMKVSANPSQALRGRRLLELVGRLEECPGPRAVGNIILDELHIAAGSRETSPVVRISVDWPDYGALRDGLPVSHYRIRVERPNAVLSEESRTPDADEAGRMIVRVLTERQ